MGKYSYKGSKKAVERFTNWHGLGILVATGVIIGRAPVAVDAWISAFRRPLIFGFLFCVRRRIALRADITSKGSSRGLRRSDLSLDPFATHRLLGIVHGSRATLPLSGRGRAADDTPGTLTSHRPI